MASRPMPWWKFSTGTRHHSKLMRLRGLLGNRLADAYVYRLWDYCAERQADGRFSGPGASLEIAIAVDFDGPTETLVPALVTAGLLDVDGDTYIVHDWADMQGALVRKFEADAGRTPGRTRSNHAVAANLSDRDAVQTLSRSCPDTVPRGTSAGPSPSLNVSSLSSTEGGVGGTIARPALVLDFASPDNSPPRPAKKPRAEPKGDPRHASLVGALVTAFREATGKAYGFRGVDARKVTELLALADQDHATAQDAAGREVERRWRIGLAWAWNNGEKPVQSLSALVTRWNECAVERGPPGNPRAPVRAETQPQYDPSKPGLQTFTGKNAL